MSNEQKKRGRKIKTIDLSTLADADEIVEEKVEPFFITCSVCGSTKNITAFKNKHICIKCIELIRERN